ncbi:hypothetical protein FBQ82_17335 [Anaerolineae bacterium CFX7]|nr:hypothetical protein [Anaerolineae bacterium CFX7]
MKRIFAALGALGAALAILFAANGAVNAQSGNTWNLFYYNNTNWAGNPVFTAAVPFLNFNWGGAPPAGNMPGVNWTMTATTTAFFNGGTYQFSALADDEVLVMVDNLSIIDTRGRNQVGKWQNSTIGLTTGNHNVQVFYRQYGGTSYLNVTWAYAKPVPNPTPTPPGPAPLPNPMAPPSATAVTTPFGDYTPCIQNGWHQSKCFVQNGTWNSTNVGSIEMEPQITIWGNCEPADSDVRWTVDANANPPVTRTFRCSKTLAGWFPTS